MTDYPYISDVTIETFVADVVETSKERLVIVDFWSPRSSACQTLSPLLEKLVIAEKGAAQLARVNLDKNPQIAQQLQLKGAPTIYAFFNKQILDGFAGLLPEAEIKTWLQKLITKTDSKAADDPAGDVKSALEQAEKYFESGDIFTANAVYLDILDYAPDEPQAHAGCIRCLLAEDKINEAAARMAQIPDSLAQDSAFDSVKATLDLAEETSGDHTETESLEDALNANPDNHQARFDLAMAYYGAKRNEDAVEALLEIIKRDRTWEKDKARKQLLKFFEAFGQMAPLTINTRKRLSTILFS